MGRWAGEVGKQVHSRGKKRTWDLKAAADQPFSPNSSMYCLHESHNFEPPSMPSALNAYHSPVSPFPKEFTLIPYLGVQGFAPSEPRLTRPRMESVI